MIVKFWVFHYLFPQKVRTGFASETVEWLFAQSITKVGLTRKVFLLFCRYVHLIPVYNSQLSSKMVESNK